MISWPILSAQLSPVDPQPIQPLNLDLDVKKSHRSGHNSGTISLIVYHEINLDLDNIGTSMGTAPSGYSAEKLRSVSSFLGPSVGTIFPCPFEAKVISGVWCRHFLVHLWGRLFAALSKLWRSLVYDVMGSWCSCGDDFSLLSLRSRAISGIWRRRFLLLMWARLFAAILAIIGDLWCMTLSALDASMGMISRCYPCKCSVETEQKETVLMNWTSWTWQQELKNFDSNSLIS